MSSNLAWWSVLIKSTIAWEACRMNTKPPEEAMRDYVAWLKSLPGRPIFVGYPVGFDFSFIYLYLMRFAGESPFGFSALDVKTYAMAVMKKEYRRSTKQ